MDDGLNFKKNSSQLSNSTAFVCMYVFVCVFTKQYVKTYHKMYFSENTGILLIIFH